MNYKQKFRRKNVKNMFFVFYKLNTSASPKMLNTEQCSKFWDAVPPNKFWFSVIFVKKSTTACYFKWLFLTKWRKNFSEKNPNLHEEPYMHIGCPDSNWISGQGPPSPWSLRSPPWDPVWGGDPYIYIGVLAPLPIHWGPCPEAQFESGHPICI